jgi:signal transduction histidine kinase
MGREVSWWRRRGGVRVHAALVAGAIVSVALLITAFVLVALTRSQLTDSVETVVITRAQDLALIVASGDLPDRLSLSGGASAQIVNSEGNVIRSTGDIEGQKAIPVLVHPPPGSVTTLTLPGLEDSEGEHEGDDEGPFLVAVAGAEYQGQPVNVVVAATLRGVGNTVTTLVPLLFIGVPLLAVVVIATTWLLTGRALSPVKEMAHEADRISGVELTRRVPLPQSRDEIYRLGETLNRMLDRLDESAASQRRFVSDASHELKSPVSSILTMAEVAALHPDRVQIEKLAADVGFEARRLAILVDDLLTLARSDEGAFTLDLSTFDLVQLIEEESASVPGAGVVVEVGAEGPLVIRADRRRLAQVVRNLLDNAVKHARSRVAITMRPIDSGVDLLVIDDGLGISEEDRERIFERFVRLDSGRGRVEGGTGLGLAVVREIVAAHGGQVEVIGGREAVGAVFRVRLPHSEATFPRIDNPGT